MQPTFQQSPKKPSFFTRVKAWIHANPKRTYALVGLGLIIAANLIVLAVFWQRPKEVEAPKKTEAVKETPKPVYQSLITGEVVDSKAAIAKPVTAVMLENSPDARPQSGLKDAEVVYEAVAEGGITRFLAVYQQKKPQLVGPVRSLRMYYLDWATPYNASIAHVGGSLNSLNAVRSGEYRDIDQFFNADYYWRANDRYAPHNVYTSFDKLDQLNIRKNYISSQPKGLERLDLSQSDKKKPSPASEDESSLQTANTISLKISGPTYNSSYQYDSASKLYARSQAGAPHLDREAGQITASVVIALRVSMTKVLEDGYRENIATTGSGEAIIFQEGKAVIATWHRDTIKEQLRFTDSAGNPIKLAAGTTWISAIPTESGNVAWE